MFGFRKTKEIPKPEVEVVGWADGMVRLKYADDLAMGLTAVVARLSPDETVEAALVIDSYLPQEDLWLAKVEAPEDLPARLEEMYPPRGPDEPEPVTWEEKRSVDRVQRGLGVMCKQFKHFKGLTYDVTAEGARFIAESHHPAGSVLDIRMEIDDARVEAMHFKAEVIWTAPVDESEKQFYMGCKIFLSDDQKEVLDDFLDFFRNYTDEVFSELYAPD